VVVVVEAATVVVVVAGGAGITVAVRLEDPVSETRLAWMTPAVVIQAEPVARIGAFGASMPELERAIFDDPLIVISALLPGVKLIVGVAGVLPFKVSCDEPVTAKRAPDSLLQARRSIDEVPHANTSDASVPVTLDELVTLNDPPNQYVPGDKVIFEDPPNVTFR
jgi:hypothetical protein